MVKRRAENDIDTEFSNATWCIYKGVREMREGGFAREAARIE